MGRVRSPARRGAGQGAGMRRDGGTGAGDGHPLLPGSVSTEPAASAAGARDHLSFQEPLATASCLRLLPSRALGVLIMR